MTAAEWAATKWERGDFFVLNGTWSPDNAPLSDGSELVEGVTRGPFGIFNNGAAHGAVSLTHLLSGARIFGLHTNEQALALADSIVELTPGTDLWESKNLRAMTENKHLRAVTIQAIQRLFPDWSPTRPGGGWARG